MATSGPARSFLASPDVYKIIAEKGETRIIFGYVET